MTPISSSSSLSPVADPYDCLKDLAQALLRNERSCTLTATGLVHELFLKVRKQRKEVAGGFDESELTPFAGRMMRQILIDRARSRATRGRAESSARVNSKPDEQSLHELRHKLMELDDLIEKLGMQLPINAELVRLHLYDEISIENAAKKLRLSRATAYRKWDFSKAWLIKHLND